MPERAMPNMATGIEKRGEILGIYKYIVKFLTFSTKQMHTQQN